MLFCKKIVANLCSYYVAKVSNIYKLFLRLESCPLVVRKFWESFFFSYDHHINTICFLITKWQDISFFRDIQSNKWKIAIQTKMRTQRPNLISKYLQEFFVIPLVSQYYQQFFKLFPIIF